MTHTHGSDYLCAKSLETYLNHLEYNEKANYFAKSIVSVESTDEEFQEFIKNFLLAINKKMIRSGTVGGFVFIDIND